MRLTTGSDLNTDPTVSPDGEWVAYASDRSGEGHLDIWMQRLSGGEAMRLTTDPADDREPTFSADGSRIAFRSEREGGGIFVVPAYSGADARLLVRGEAHGPRFSPDGRWLAYSTGPGRFTTDKSLCFISQTYLIPSTGGESTRLLPDFASASWPVWSPDSHHLLLTARRNPTDDPEWWVLALDSRPPVRIDGIDVLSGGSRLPVRPWSWTERKPPRVFDRARWRQLGSLGDLDRAGHMDAVHAADAAHDGSQPAGARVHRARRATGLRQFDPDRQRVERAARRQRGSRARRRATGHGHVHARSGGRTRREMAGAWCFAPTGRRLPVSG